MQGADVNFRLSRSSRLHGLLSPSLSSMPDFPELQGVAGKLELRLELDSSIGLKVAYQVMD